MYLGEPDSHLMFTGLSNARNGTEITSLLLEHRQVLTYSSVRLAAQTSSSSRLLGFQEKTETKQKSYNIHCTHGLKTSTETFLKLLIIVRMLLNLKYNSVICLRVRRLNNERTLSLPQTHTKFTLQEGMTTPVYQHFIHSLEHEYLKRRHFSPCRSLNRSSYLK